MRWAATTAIVGVTVFLSTLPGGTHLPNNQFVWIIDGTPSFFQNFMHMVIYGVMTVSLAWSLEGTFTNRRHWWIAALFCSALGISLEWYQTQVPGRFGTLLDILLNTAGVAISAMIATRLGRSPLTDPVEQPGR